MAANMENSSLFEENLLNILSELSQNLPSNDEDAKESSEESSNTNGLQNYDSSPSTQQTRLSDMTDEKLKCLPICELNQMLRECQEPEAQEIRRRRRCLKNREYAVSARLKRVKVQEHLETENDKLKAEVSKAKAEQARIKAERDMYRRNSEVLEAAWTSLSQCVEQANSENSR